MRKFFKIVGIVLLSLVGVAVVAWLGLTTYFYLMTNDITPSDDSDLRIVEEAIPDAENAYVAFLAVTNLYMISVDDATVCTTYRQWRRDGIANVGIAHTNDWRATVDRVLADHASYFAGLHKTVALPRYRLAKENGAWGWMTVPPVTGIMRAHNLWTTKAMREIDRRDYAAALETVRDHLAFGRKIGGNPSTLIELLIGLGIEDCAYDSAASLATCEDVSDDVLSALADLTRDEVDVPSAFARAVKCEYANFAGALRDMKITDEAIVMSFLAEMFGRGCWLCRTPGYMRFSLQPGATRQLHAEAIRAMLKGEDVEKAVPKPCLFIEPNWAGKTMIRTMLSEVHAEHPRFKMHRLKTRFARIVIAAQRYRRANGGKYPPSLDVLVPVYLDAVPHDPFAPDFELRYDVAKGIVWSVGTDGNFNPFVAQTPHNLWQFNKDMDRYAVRLDGKRHERRQRWKKKAKKTAPKTDSPASEK